jgi:hypothetical protein
MSATISYKHLSQLVNQLINVIDQTDVTSEVCHSEVEREHRRSRLSRELRTVLSRLRETQRDIEQYLAPVAPIRRVESLALDDDWEQIIEELKRQLESADKIPTGGFCYDLVPPVSTQTRSIKDAHRHNIYGFVQYLDRMWEDIEDDRDAQEEMIGLVVELINKEFQPQGCPEFRYKRTTASASGAYRWTSISDSSTARGSDA